MLKHRLQVLIEPEQRRRLDRAARRRGVSVGAVVRDAIDSQLGASNRAKRLTAVEEMAEAAASEALAVEELDRIVDAERGRGPDRIERDRRSQ